MNNVFAKDTSWGENLAITSMEDDKTNTSIASQKLKLIFLCELHILLNQFQ